MSTLEASSFGDFFAALHGYRPFRWQQRLLDQVVSGDWPEALALPTASGKTACIDIAIFALACQADWPAAKRTAPRRIFFVVDRRIIVDEAFERATKIARRLKDELRDANSGTLFEVAQRLRELTGDPDADPLASAQLRGGIRRDSTWAETPTQPVVICSTVDQVGSRMLFRGYGLGSAAHVVQAGLTTNDALVLLDEAHCAQPFYQTGKAIRDYRDWSATGHAVPVPFHFVVMSATPPAEIPAAAIFPRRDEWDADLAHDDQSVLRNRVTASKPATLLEPVAGDKAKSHDKLVTAMVKAAIDRIDVDHQRMGLIVNRVAVAKSLAAKLKDAGHDVVLMTGRMRGIDRDELLEQWQPSEWKNGGSQKSGLLEVFSVTSARPALTKPVFVVATQCLEVGANLDFDVLVTECASLDALRQRFGRLNRAGRTTADDKPFEARAAIIIREDQVAPKTPDPIYGEALAATWKWLNEVAASTGETRLVDFGIDAFEKLLPSAVEERSELIASLQMPTANAPVMLPAHVDCWAQTSRRPMPEPEPSLFLHGPSGNLPEVRVCWRADLIEPADPKSDTEWSDRWINALSYCPPSVAECLSIPLPYLRSWLAQTSTDDRLADVDVPDQEADDDNGESQLCGIIWRGVEKSESLSLTALHPNDVVVFSTEPSVEPALFQAFGHRHERLSSFDCGDESNFAMRGRAVLRLHPSIVASWFPPPTADSDRDDADDQGSDDRNDTHRFQTAISELLVIPEEFDSRDAEKEHIQKLQDALHELQQVGLLPARLKRLVNVLAESALSKISIAPHPCGSSGEADSGERTHRGLILKVKGLFRRDPLDDQFIHENDGWSQTKKVNLFEHLAGVEEFARRFATRAGLPSELCDDFALAARWHDAGKQDSRFQAWLHGGDVFKARLAPEPLAKSEGQSTRAERERARSRSGYPKGARHELLSVRLLEQAASELNAAHDRDLVLHLIASHHGHCRPFAPVIVDKDCFQVRHQSKGVVVEASNRTELERLDSGVSERFWKLIRKYGWWGLAWLESLLVLADHRRSEWEQNE